MRPRLDFFSLALLMVALTVTGLLSGCGQRGGLYLPDERAETVEQSQEPDDDGDEDEVKVQAP